VDAALEDLSSAVRDLCASHRRGRGPTTNSDLHLLSDVSQDSYHQSEDGYLLELVNYTKKQFFKVSGAWLVLFLSFYTILVRALLIYTRGCVLEEYIII